MKELFVEYRAITLMLGVCLSVNILYAITYYMPDYFGIKGWYDFINNLSISYVAAYLFFVFQVYMPQKKKNKQALAILKIRLTKIVRQLERDVHFLQLIASYDSDKISTNLNFDKILYFRIKRKVGGDILEFANVSNELKNMEEGLQKLIDKLKANSQFVLLNEAVIENISKLEIELSKSHFKQLGQMYSIVCSIQGIEEEYKNLCLQLKILAQYLNYKMEIDCLELLNKQEIEEYKAHIRSFKENNIFTTTKI